MDAANNEKPPRLNFSELMIVKKDRVWHEALRCVQAYHQQAVAMDLDERKTMIEIIKNGEYEISNSGKTSPGAHCLYRRAIHRRSRRDRPEELRWSEYVTLKAIYPKQSLSTRYLNMVRQKFGTLVIKDLSRQYYDLYPGDKQEMEDLMRIAKGNMEWLDIDPSDNEGGKDDESDDNENDDEEERRDTSAPPSKKRKRSNEKGKDDDEQRRLNILHLMNLSAADLEGIGSDGTVKKDGIVIKLLPAEMIKIARGRTVESAGNGSLRAQTPGSKRTPQSATKGGKGKATDDPKETLPEETQELRSVISTGDSAFNSMIEMFAKKPAANQPALVTTNKPAEQERQKCSTANLEEHIEKLEKAQKEAENNREKDHRLIMNLLDTLVRVEKNQQMFLSEQKVAREERKMQDEKIEGLSREIRENTKAQNDHQEKRERSDTQIRTYMMAMATRICDDAQRL